MMNSNIMGFLLFIAIFSSVVATTNTTTPNTPNTTTPSPPSPPSPPNPPNPPSPPNPPNPPLQKKDQATDTLIILGAIVGILLLVCLLGCYSDCICCCCDMCNPCDNRSYDGGYADYFSSDASYYIKKNTNEGDRKFEQYLIDRQPDIETCNDVPNQQPQTTGISIE